MDVLIRAATPDDVEGAVPCIYSSGPAAFDYVFSHRTPINAHQFRTNAFVRPDGEFSYRYHIVAERDGRVVATGAGFDGNDAKTFAFPALRGILGGYGLRHGIGVIRRGLTLEHTLVPPKDGQYCVAHLGVDPSLRGSGIGSQLIDHLLAEARARKSATAILDVSVENPRAQALYERLGFEVIVETASTMSNSTATVPGHRRMVLSLSA